MAAHGSETAIKAIGAPGLAYVTPMKNEPMVGFGHNFGRDIAHQGLFGLQGSAGIGGETDAFAYTKHMSVHSHCRFSPHNRPTPGSVRSESISEGTSPPKFSTRVRAIPKSDFVLLLG